MVSDDEIIDNFNIATDENEYADVRTVALKFLQKNADKLKNTQIEKIYKIAIDKDEYNFLRITALKFLQEVSGSLDKTQIEEIYNIAIDKDEFFLLRIFALKFLQTVPDKLDNTQLKEIFEIAADVYENDEVRIAAFRFLQTVPDKLDNTQLKEIFEMAAEGYENYENNWLECITWKDSRNFYNCSAALEVLQEVLDKLDKLNKLDEPLIETICNIVNNRDENGNVTYIYNDFRVLAFRFLQKNPDKLDIVEFKSIYDIAIDDDEIDSIRIAALNFLLTLPKYTLNKLKIHHEDLYMKIDNMLTDEQENKDLVEKFEMLQKRLKRGNQELKNKTNDGKINNNLTKLKR